MIKRLHVAQTAMHMVIWAVALASGACSSENEASESSVNDAVEDSWDGATPHLQMSGTIADTALEARVTGSDAADLGTLYCERNYIVPDLEDESSYVDGYLEKVEFKYNYFYQNKLAEFQLELEGDDLFSKVGQTLNVAEDVAVSVQIKVDEDGPSEEEFEGEGVSGTVYLALLSGEVGSDGLTVPDGEGALGAAVSIQLESGETVSGSFTVNCAENDLEIPEE